MKTAEQKAAKILLALDSASHNLAARNFALSLARQLQTELIGLFVEDEELLSSAQYPFASEIIASSANERKLGYTELERSLRAWSTQIQQQIIKQAQQAQIKCTFRTFRGRKTELFLQQSEVSSLLVFPGLRNSFSISQHKPHTAYLLVDNRSDLEHSLLVIKQLVDEGINDIVIINNDDKQSEEQAQRFITKIATLNKNTQVKQLQVETNIPQHLLILTRNQPAAVVLVPAGHHICQQLSVFKEMQNYLSCPVVVVN